MRTFNSLGGASDNAVGTIFQMQRWSINDGEGIRTTVFLKGCPLRCAWCANPESWNGQPEVLYFRDRCSDCGHCVQVCKAGAIRTECGQITGSERAKCTSCFHCCEECPTGARKKMGSTVNVAEVLAALKRDTVFYRESGGGVTFSGGEPFAQPEFLRQLVSSCKRLGIDTAVETCGYFNWDDGKDIVANLDCVFVDIKHMDEDIHRKLTGVSNRIILENIAFISKVQPETIVRVPLIEEVNATEENIEKMCEFLRNNTRVSKVELLSYHDFGEKKYSAVGAIGHTFQAPAEAKVAELREKIADCGLIVVDYK